MMTLSLNLSIRGVESSLGLVVARVFFFFFKVDRKQDCQKTEALTLNKGIYRLTMGLSDFISSWPWATSTSLIGLIN